MQIPGQFLTAPLIHRMAAQGLGIYNREYPPYMAGSSSDADRRTLVIPPIRVDIGGIGHYNPDEVELDLNDANSWDTATPTDYATAANRAGVDFFVYVCRPAAGRVPTILLSASSTAPSGYTISNSRRIGGFHCLPGNCTNLPVGHPYKDFAVGNILFNSIWDLIDSPRSVLKRGMAKISLTPWDGQPALWVDIYLASGTGTTCTSVFGATIKDTVDWNTFVEYGRLQGKRLLRDHEFQQASIGSNEETNIAGSADPGTVTFPLDTAGRSMISYYGIIGMCGVLWQWLDEQSYRFDPDGSVSAASKTIIAYHAASPGGNPIYAKFLANGEPYLCCNMATDAVDKWLTLGTDYKVLIKHDPDAATGSSQIYFDEDATQPGRFLVNMARGKSAYVQSNNPSFALQLTHNANAATAGVAIYFDDGADERLEFVSPTSANGTIDLSLLGGSGWAHYNLPGTVGSLYRQGAYGDAKLLGGGTWSLATIAGSRARSASDCRWAAYSAVGGRFVAEPV